MAVPSAVCQCTDAVWFCGTARLIVNGSGFVPTSPSVIDDPTMLTGSSPSLVARKALRAVFQWSARYPPGDDDALK